MNNTILNFIPSIIFNPSNAAARHSCRWQPAQLLQQACECPECLNLGGKGSEVLEMKAHSQIDWRPLNQQQQQQHTIKGIGVLKRRRKVENVSLVASYGAQKPLSSSSKLVPPLNPRPFQYSTASHRTTQDKPASHSNVYEQKGIPNLSRTKPFNLGRRRHAGCNGKRSLHDVERASGKFFSANEKLMRRYIAQNVVFKSDGLFVRASAIHIDQYSASMNVSIEENKKLM
jgi:hypothetical protein